MIYWPAVILFAQIVLLLVGIFGIIEGWKSRVPMLCLAAAFIIGLVMVAS